MSAGCCPWAVSFSPRPRRGWLSLGHGCLEDASGFTVAPARSAQRGGCGEGGEDAHGHPIGTSRVTRTSDLLSATRFSSRSSAPQWRGTDGLTTSLLPVWPWTSVARVAAGWPEVGSPGPGWYRSQPAVPGSAASAGRERGRGVQRYGVSAALLPPEGRAERQGNTWGRIGGSKVHF